MQCLVLYTSFNRCAYAAVFDIELEAIEACEWLRETGFPQYAQLYRSTYMLALQNTLLQCSFDFFWFPPLYYPLFSPSVHCNLRRGIQQGAAAVMTDSHCGFTVDLQVHWAETTHVVTGQRTLLCSITQKASVYLIIPIQMWVYCRLFLSSFMFCVAAAYTASCVLTLLSTCQTFCTAVNNVVVRKHREIVIHCQS